MELPEKQGLKLMKGNGDILNLLIVAVELPEKQGLKPNSECIFIHKGARVAVELPEKQGLKQYAVLNKSLKSNPWLQWNFQKNKD